MSDVQDHHDFDVVTEKKEKLKRPDLFKVLIHNDDYTTMEFVIQILKTFFQKSETEAIHIMLNVHKKGTGVAGIYPFHIAETKIYQVHSLAKSDQHPLKCSLEPE